MKHVVYKVFTIGGFKKEEKWLNQMAAKGMMLTHVGFCRYVFEEGNPGEYIYRLELLENIPSHTESVAYIKFVEETGAVHVSSMFRWVYFRKKAIEGGFDLYSDLDSKIQQHKRINALCRWIIVIELSAGISFILKSAHHFHQNGLGGITSNMDFWLAIFYVALTIIIFFIGRPIRKNLKEMKIEQSIRE